MGAGKRWASMIRGHRGKSWAVGGRRKLRQAADPWPSRLPAADQLPGMGSRDQQRRPLSGRASHSIVRRARVNAVREADEPGTAAGIAPRGHRR